MRGFITDYWWVITGAILMIVLAIHRYRTRPNFGRPTNAKSFAAIRVFRPAELAPYFGTYVPQWTDLLGFVLFVVWFGVMVGIVVWDLGGATTPIFVSAGAAVLIAALAVVVDTRSVRVISADRIAFESPLPSLSWSVPTNQITQCDLVPGKPHARLRVHSRSGSFSLPLTNELWAAFSQRVG